MDSTSELKRVLTRNKIILVCLAGLVVVMSGIGVWLSIKRSGGALHWPDASLGLSSAFLLAGLTYVIAQIFGIYRSIEQSIQLDAELDPRLKPIIEGIQHILKAIRERDREIRQVKSTDWSLLFEDTTEIDFIVQSWHSWVSSVDSTRLEAFFRRGGRMNLFVYDYAADYQASLHKPMTLRMNLSLTTVVDEIKLTIFNILSAAQRASTGTAGRSIADLVQVRLMNCCNWYCAAWFKPNRLLLSPYAHHFDGVKEAPTLVVDMATHPSIKTWFENELRFFSNPTHSKPYDVTLPLDALSPGDSNDKAR